MFTPNQPIKPVANSTGQKPADVKAQAQKQVIQRGTPTIGAFSIKVKLKDDLKEVSNALRSLSFLEVAQEKDTVNALYVESRDINKQPYIFSIFKASDSMLELAYSIPAGLAPTRRRLDMVRYFINLLTLLEPYYEIDNKIVLQLMESSIKDVVDSISMDYSKLYTEYDTIKKEGEDLKRKAKRFSEDNASLSNDNYELKNKNDEMLLRLKQLESMPEEALKVKLQEWILEHNGEINVAEFASANNISVSFVEETLNRLITEGYIEAVR